MQIDEERQDFMPGDLMAQNDINIGLNVTSNGTIKQETDGAQKLAQALKDAEGSATRTSKALSSAKSASAPSAKTKAPTVEENINYGISRAAVGTGAASRDFANQSQGLGGLVRLYATFAANIFALTAAFTALSNAADTSNLVKGLDQLGAASGRALGTLSKQLAEASEGAISLRDSMESVAKASSAGLSNKQILALGESAKQASQALGLSMPDALNRLTRGIAKIEPELLDELGIFVKIDDATRKYALSLGRAASSLTDFERRQAFANAVLDQAKEKFGEIKLDVNPYSKLLAAFQNISFAGLELVNKVLGPIVKLLSESPTAFSAVLAAIGVKLISTAIPAIGEWRNGLKAAAEDAAKVADVVSKSFGDEFQGKLEASFRLPQLQKSLDAAKKNVASIKDSIPQSLPIPATIAKSAFSTASRDEKGFNAVNRAIESRQKLLAAVDAQEKRLSAERIQSKQKEIEFLKNEQAIILRTIELRKAENIAKQRSLAYEQAADQALSAADKKQGRFDTEVIALKQAEKARINYEKVSAISNAVETTRVLGVRLAWQRLNNEIADRGITGLDKYTTLAKGGLASVGTRVLGIAGSFANLIPQAALAFAAFETVSAIFSKNDKEVSEFKSSIEDTNKSVEVLAATFDKISKKDPLAQVSVASVTALSTAFNGLADSTEALVSSLAKADKVASGFDKLIDGFLTVIGKDLKSNFSRTIALSIEEAFTSLPEGEAKEALGNKLKSIVGVAELATKDISEALGKLDGSTVIDIGRKVSAAQKETADSLRNTANAAQGFKETLEASTKAYDEMSLSLASSDPISKLALSLISSGNAITQVISKTNGGITGLVEILNDTKKLSLLPENARNLLLAYKDDIEGSQISISKYSKELTEAKKKVKELAEEQSRYKTAEEQLAPDVSGEALTAQFAKLDNANAKIKENQDKQRAIINEFLDAGNLVFKNGTELLARQISSAKQQAASTIFKAETQRATGFAKIAIDANLARQDIDIQLKSIDVQERLIISQNKTNLLLEQSLLEAKRQKLEQAAGEGRARGSSVAELEKITKEIEVNKQAITKLDAGSRNFDPRSVSQEVALKLGPLLAQFSASSAQRIKLGADKSAVKISAGIQTEEQEFKVAQDTLKAKNDLLAVDKERLVLLNSLANGENSVLLALKQQAEISADQRASDLARADLVRSIVVAADTAAKTRAKGTEEEITASNREYFILVQQLQVYDKQVEAKNRLRDISLELERIDARASTASKDLEFSTELSQLKRDTFEAELTASKEYLDYLIQIKAVNEADGISRAAALEKQLLLQKQVSEEASVKSSAAAERAGAATLAEKQRTVAGTDEDKLKEINSALVTELQRINELEDERLRKIKLQTEAKMELNAQIAKEAEQYAKIDSIGQTLAKVFEGVGQSASKFGAGIGNVLKTFATINNKRVAMETDTAKKLAKINTNTNEGYLEYQVEKDKAVKKSKEFELEAVAEQAGAAKGLFAEKTTAYKALAAIEKALLVVRLAGMAQEAATSIATLGAVLFSENAKSVAKGKGAVLNMLSNIPPPFNYVAAGVMAAVVASILGGGSSKISIPAGTSAEDRQEVQGTGMSYVNGKKVENGGGVFGDSSAKSESINKSLEVIKNTSVEGLTFTNKMVSLLEKINVGINGAAKSLYSIPGIRTGSQFGTQETTKSSGIQGLFGKTVSKNITDSGIKISGVFTDLLNNAKGFVKGYETLSTTTKRSGFLGIGGSTKSSISTQYKTLDETVTKQISDVFKNATDLFVDVGGKLGITAEAVFNKLGSIKIDQLASLKGLQGADLEKELNAVLSNILDNASNVLFSSLDKYKQFGEGMLETVVRVIDTNEKVKDSFKSVTKIVSDTSFDVTNSLATLSGGLDNFLDSIASYKDAFLSEAEQLVPIQTAVTAELSRLGFSSVKTADDFKYLINSLDVTTSVGQETFVSLLKISDSFARLSAAADKTDNLRIDLLEAEGKASEATALRRAKELKEMSATDAELQKRIWLLEDEKTLITDTYSYEYKILQLLNKSEEALALAREKELSNTDEQLRAVQSYIFAIEDEITAREKASKAIDTTIGSFKNSITTLKELRSSLLGGDKSILTPQEKYEQAKKEATAVIAAASAPASSVEEILVREAAISKLPQVTGTWLEASRNLYASSLQYTQDFNTVLAALDSTSASLESQLTDAEKQLQLLKDSSNILSTIEDNTFSTTQLLEKFLVSAEATRVATATVPTISNTVTNPAIPAADNTANVSQELIAELIKFNKEALEKQLAAQAEATAAIIRANAAAEAANAAAIVAAQQEAARQVEWNKKSAPVLDYGYASGMGA